MGKGTHYDILGVSADASEAEIRKAWKKKMLQWHPDKCKESKEIADEKSKELNAAYQVLSDAETRKEYDKEINPAPFAPQSPSSGPKQPNHPNSMPKSQSTSFPAREQYHQYREKMSETRTQEGASRTPSSRPEACYSFYSTQTNCRKDSIPLSKSKPHFVYQSTLKLEDLLKMIQTELKSVYAQLSLREESPKIAKCGTYFNVETRHSQHMEKAMDNLLLKMILLELMQASWPQAAQSEQETFRPKI